MKKLLFILVICLAGQAVAGGKELVQEALQCTDRGDYKCAISKMESALDYGDLEPDAMKLAGSMLKDIYIPYIDQNINSFSADKTIRLSKIAIELSSKYDARKDFNDAILHAWVSTRSSDVGNSRDAEKYHQSALNIINSKEVIDDLSAHEYKEASSYVHQLLGL